MNVFIDWLHSTQGSVTATVLLLTSFFSWKGWAILQTLSERFAGQRRDSQWASRIERLFQRLRQVWVIAACLLGGISLLIARAVTSPCISPECMTEAAWRAYNSAKIAAMNGKEDRASVEFKNAIRLADLVIAEFHGQATVKEEQLSAGKVAPINPNKVDEVNKRMIFSWGPINEVAACLIIKGEALFGLGRTNEARVSFRAVESLPHALIWDPSTQTFWPAVERAKGRLLTTLPLASVAP